MGYAIDSMMVIDTMLIKQKFNYDTIIETGTAKGDSTQLLQYMFKKVYSCEIDPSMDYHIKNQTILEDNVQIEFGNSPDLLKKWFKEIGHDKFFLFLDAHWESYWPLRDELQQVINFGYKPVIIIHDFDCGKPGWIYDIYGGQHLNWNYIKDKINQIYGENGYDFKVSHRCFHPKIPFRGCAYITPKINENKVEIKKRWYLFNIKHLFK